jgi:AcrR family transcriptional regulator
VPAATRRRGRPASGSSEETWRRILDVARQAFSAHGYSAAMALYNYAPSKAALFVAVWEDAIEQIYADYEHVVAGRGSLLEEVEALLDRSRELLIERPDHTRLVLRVLLDHEHPELVGADLQPRAAVEFYDHLAARGVKRGEITKRDRDHLVVFIVTTLWGITTLAAFDPTTLDHSVAAAKWAARRQLAPGGHP